jgi:host factor-I protein
MESPSLDPSLPGVRQLQDWIRESTPLQVQLMDGTCLGGSLHWQDPEFLALRPAPNTPLILLGRKAVAVIRSLA